MSKFHTTVLDTEGLLRLFRELRGLNFVGPVDGLGCIELVFSDPDGRGRNLVTIFTEGQRRGQIALGFIAQELIEAGYVRHPEDEQE